MWNRIELKMRGKQAFKRNYWPCVGVAFVMTIVMLLTTGGGAGSSAGSDRYVSQGMQNQEGLWAEEYAGNYDGVFSVIGLLLGAVTAALVLLGVLLKIFVGNILEVGGKKFFVLNQTETPGAGTVLDGFRSGHYGNTVLTMFLMNLFIGLWSLLLIVPGIVKSYEYRMIPYILAENPGMERKEAFAISKRMMNGQKMDTFIMDLSFIGWFFLSLLTCGLVGIFYMTPYTEASFAELYSFNRAKAYTEGYIR